MLDKIKKNIDIVHQLHEDGDITDIEYLSIMHKIFDVLNTYPFVVPNPPNPPPMDSTQDKTV